MFFLLYFVEFEKIPGSTNAFCKKFDDVYIATKPREGWFIDSDSSVIVNFLDNINHTKKAVYLTEDPTKVTYESKEEIVRTCNSLEPVKTFLTFINCNSCQDIFMTHYIKCNYQESHTIYCPFGFSTLWTYCYDCT